MIGSTKNATSSAVTRTLRMSGNQLRLFRTSRRSSNRMLSVWPQKREARLTARLGPDRLADVECARVDVLLRLILVVRAAAKLDVLDGRRSALRIRHDVVKLEESPLGTAALRTDETASAIVALPDRPSNIGGD